MAKPKTCTTPSQYSSQRQIALVRAWLNSPLTLAAFCEEVSVRINGVLSS